MITVDYTALTAFQGRMRDIYADIEQHLDDLAAGIDNLATLWEGAAAEGFQKTIQSWQGSAADLRDRLAELHNMVGVAHDNQAAVVRSNTGIWAGRG